MKNWLKKVTLEKIGVFSFLLFLVLTPVILKIKIWEDIYVEPLLPFLILGTGFLVFHQNKRLKDIWKSIKQIILPNRLAFLYFSLMLVLLLTFVYGYFLTGIFSLGTFLRLIKYTLYFLPFPLAIYTGRYLGRTNTNRVLVLLVLVGVATALVSLIRVFTFLQSGGVIDFWEYGIYNRSVGVLGQFFDPLNLTTGLTGKAAHGTYGLYATIILTICLVIVSRFKEFSSRWFTFFGMATFIFYGAILYTLSRGAIITAVLVFGGWFLWLLKEKKIKVIVFTVLFLALTSSLLVWLNPQVYDKFASTLTFLPERTGQSVSGDPISKNWGDEWDLALDASSRGRLERWGAIITTLKENPAFTIFGVGYSRENLEKFTGVSLTHSLFLDLWARGGIISLILLIGIWILIFGYILRFTISADSEVATFGFLLGGFATGWLLDNLISGEQFFSDAPMILFWGVLGLVQALSRIGRDAEDRPKKVLLALTSSDVGGAPQVVYSLLDNLSKEQRESFEFVIAAPSGGVFNEKFRKLNVKTYPVDLNRISWGTFKKFLAVFQKEEINLISSHGKGAGFYARKAGFLLGIPVVQTFHGLHYSRKNPLAKFLYLWLERILGIFTTRVISVSKSQEKEGLRLRIFSKRKSRVVLNGIRVSENKEIVGKLGQEFRRKLGIKDKDFAVLMVARFDEVKGHKRFIELLPNLVKKIPNLKVIFAGGGEGQKTSMEQVRELGVEKNALFLGERHDVARIISVSDALVLPSYHEGLPLAPLEASAQGVPVIGSDVVGIKDTIQNRKTGYLVNFDNPKEVVIAFQRLAKSPNLRGKMGEQGQEFVKKEFSMDKFVAKTLKVYQEALSF